MSTKFFIGGPSFTATVEVNTHNQFDEEIAWKEISTAIINVVGDIMGNYPYEYTTTLLNKE